MSELKLTAAIIASFLAFSATGVPAQSIADLSALPAAAEQEPWLKVYFASGSSRITADQAATLDRAVRTFREGDPFVMIVAGGADRVGDPSGNLQLSLARANAVALELTSRGIPIERLQVLGRGTSELEIQTGDGIAEEENRVVEISWR